ncbi:cytochrome P450 [Immersiella caudata]|uniref:Cytochrome P450 n=1 Tax=Immersiella caudata TaxID=314043 RepID=A0AA40BXQ5_9PEZI|nr:cytochrome P450 [Immersiella caudata]
MTYLQAVIKEGMRWHPPVASMLSKKVPATGDEWKGDTFPPGTEVGYCAWSVMHDEKFWGEDHGEFRPERWLEADGPRLKAIDATPDPSFWEWAVAVPGQERGGDRVEQAFVEVSEPLLLLWMSADKIASSSV